MSSKTKIVVLRMKEIIYTAIFVGLGILLITLFLIMFRSGENAAPTSSEGAAHLSENSASYIPGIYSASLVLGSQNVELEVTVDSERIKSITCKSLSDAIETMYPLVTPAAASLAEQIVTNQSLENLNYPDGSHYTSQAIVQAVRKALEMAAAE